MARLRVRVACPCHVSCFSDGRISDDQVRIVPICVGRAKTPGTVGKFRVQRQGSDKV